jgi:hypothetical protein
LYLKANSYNPRRLELARAGLIRQTGAKRRLDSGNSGHVWIATGAPYDEELIRRCCSPDARRELQDQGEPPAAVGVSTGGPAAELAPDLVDGPMRAADPEEALTLLVTRAGEPIHVETPNVFDTSAPVRSVPHGVNLDAASVFIGAGRAGLA